MKLQFSIISGIFILKQSNFSHPFEIFDLVFVDTAGKKLSKTTKFPQLEAYYPVYLYGEQVNKISNFAINESFLVGKYVGYKFVTERDEWGCLI